MQKNYHSNSHSRIQSQAFVESPQVRIYNRHFYLRKAEHDLLQQQHYNQLKKLANTPKITVSSYHILSQKLEDNLEDVITKSIINKNKSKYVIDPKNKKQIVRELLEKESLDFRQLQGILEIVTGINEEKGGVQMEHFLSQIWLILVRYQLQSKKGIRARTLYSVLRILLDPYNLRCKQLQEMLNTLIEFEGAQKRRQNFLAQYPDLSDQTLEVPEILKLWRKIRYENPHFNSFFDHNKTRKTSVSPLNSRPSMNSKSKRLAEESIKKYLNTHGSLHQSNLQNHKKSKTYTQNQLARYFQNSPSNDETENDNSQLSYHEILYRRKLKKDQLPQIKIDNQSQYFTQKNSRIANPAEIKEIVNNLYVVRPKREDVDHEKIKEEKQLQKCTFSPKINKDYNYLSNSRNSVSPSVKGFSKQIDRMEKARIEKERKRLAYENLGRVKNARNHSKSPRHVQAPKFLARDTPKLILEINIDGNRIQKLPLKGDENPRLVSKKFVLMHGLEQEMVEVLEELVKEQLTNL